MHNSAYRSEHEIGFICYILNPGAPSLELFESLAIISLLLAEVMGLQMVTSFTP